MTKAEYKRMIAAANALAEGIDRPMHFDVDARLCQTGWRRV